MSFKRDIEDQAIKALADKMNNTLDDIVKEGLKLKGIVFETNYHYGEFIKHNCTKQIDAYGVETYYVCGDPFLEYHKPQEYLNPPRLNSDPSEPYRITATLGQYKFI